MTQQVLIDTEFHLEKIDPKNRDIFRSALPFLETRKNKPHTYLAYQYALDLLKHETGRPEIVEPAVILHDVGWSTISETEQLTAFGPIVKNSSLQRKHEIEGVAIAERILSNLNWEQHLMSKILDIIDGHDTTRQARSLEDAIVKDADKLWRVSKIGFQTDAQRFKTQPVSYIKYLREAAHGWFLTGRGRKIALAELQMRESELEFTTN